MASMALNTNQMDLSQHPLRAVGAALGALQGEPRGPRLSHMQGANEGPADVIKKVSGAVAGGKREDDGLYFTNNEGIPFPDPCVNELEAIKMRKDILG
jgi:catalase